MSKKARALVLAMGAVIVVAALVAAVLWLKNSALVTNDTEDAATSLPRESAQTRVAPMNPLLKSSVDENGNGTDDYTDFVAGARKVAKEHPTYDDGYYQGGYPPAGRGACTDLIVEAFKNAGYDLKAMVDADIAAHPNHYPSVTAPDPNIDYRRTGTLGRFFALHAISLTTDVTDTAQWQQGDIVVFETTRHIGMVSDTRDQKGIATFIHNNHQAGPFEEDFLAHTKLKITGHFRFDASKIPVSVLRRATSATK